MGDEGEENPPSPGFIIFILFYALFRSASFIGPKQHTTDDEALRRGCSIL
jgi:hypothetical protein